MKKALQVASVASMIDQFNMENIKILQDLGYTVDVAANFDFGNTSSKNRVNEFKEELKKKNIKYYNLLFDRNIFNFINLKVYRQLKKIINENNYDIIHCHSPIGGVITRLAARKARKKGAKVIYTAHGFHFFRGASIINWLVYFPIEWINSFLTDILITINKEDYNLAKKIMKANKIYYVPGIGIDTNSKDVGESKYRKRCELKIPQNSIVLFSVGELNKNKNHEVIIRAMADIKDPNIYYCIAGKGKLQEYLLKLAKELKIENNFKLLGFRNDIKELLKMSDIYVFPSHREGLSVALMEAMSEGLPVICSYIRGNTDLIDDGKGGYLVKNNNLDIFKNSIVKLSFNNELRNYMGIYNKDKIKKFDIENVKERMREIYLKEE